jgi:hypothetical protein
MTGEILRATPSKPYLCLVLTIEPSLVFELALAADTVERPKPTAGGPAVFTGGDPVMTDAFTRLLTCLNNRTDAAVPVRSAQAAARCDDERGRGRFSRRLSERVAVQPRVRGILRPAADR